MRREFLISVFLVFFFLPVSGQTEKAMLWVPQKMITDETYESTIILDNASSSGQTIVLSTSDPSIISVPESVLVLPHHNHGIFKIKALREGTAQVFAVIEGKIISSQTTVYSSSIVPTALSVLLPANYTKTDEIIGYVLSVDAKGAPAPVLKDTWITLSTSPMIKTDDKIKIKHGSHYAKFFAKIMGSGRIFASAPELGLGEAQMTKLRDEVTVMVKVAPDIILENSKAYYYVWLEKDGKPFKPPYVVHAFMSSSNLNSIRFNENAHIRQYSDSVLKTSLVDGVGSGILISSDRGSAIITADVEGFGSAQTNVVVGPVLINENFKFLEEESRNKIKEIEKRKPNVAFMWAYPSVTDSKAFGVIGLYNMNLTKNTITHVDSNGTSVIITNSINRVEPVPIDGRMVTVTSPGLDHPSIVSLSESNEISMKRGIGFNHAVEFPILGSVQGNHTVSVSGPGLERFQTMLQVWPPHVESYRIKMVPIPSLPNSEQDLAMISIFDAYDALVDVQKTLAGTIELSVSTESGGKKNIGISNQNSAILAGSLSGAERVVVSADGINPYENTIFPSGIADSISLDVPERVHILEEAPYVVHELDSHGIPLKRINFTNISTTPRTTVSNDRIIIINAGVEDFAVLSRLGADSKKIEAFANQMSLQITPHGITNRVNKEFELTINTDVQDTQIIIDSPFPYKKINNRTFVITPDREGHFNITFTGLREGYAAAKSTFAVYAEKIFSIFFNAVDSTKKELHVNSLIKTDDVTKSLATPHQHELRPQFLSVEFPETFETGQNGYQLDHVMFGDQRLTGGVINQIYVDSDTAITAQYQKMVSVQTENALGSGYYPYGTAVTLSVPPKDKALFFVREVFDHWEGISYDSDTVTLIATETIDAKAVLREDYSFLMLTCGIVLTTMSYFRFVWKRGINLHWYARKLIDTMRIPKVQKFWPALRKKNVRAQKILSNDKNEIDF
ncbi:MAG: hypothetical protein ACREAX_04425 [Candidatus Nitrosotenuis sp.]